MLYYLALALLPYVNAVNVLTYHTVRAGGAALTGFLFCLVVGPSIIRQLRALKVGQYIRKDHVADLHELHKGKAGTPTMGGAMIIISTVLTLALWGRLTNRLLWVSVGAFVLLGVVGFVDDYIKLKRKHNDGLSARAKFAGQILTGLLLGLYLVNNPITISASYVYARDVLDWRGLVQALVEGGAAPEATPVKHIWRALEPQAQTAFEQAGDKRFFSRDERKALLQGLNAVVGKRRLYDAALWPEAQLSQEAKELLTRDVDALSDLEVVRLDRLLLEASLPKAIAKSSPNLHTKVGIPGFKDVYIPLGPLYILFVILVIVSVSNAVNLTDGLDGLAAGTSIISILTYAGIAYIVSRADWSQYLFLTYVPEASELFVFGSALLGTGLGFLWFNSHPAEVFMGDTGSLALGGAHCDLGAADQAGTLAPVGGGTLRLRGGQRGDSSRLVQDDGQALFPHGAPPSPFRVIRLGGNQSHHALLDYRPALRVDEPGHPQTALTSITCLYAAEAGRNQALRPCHEGQGMTVRDKKVLVVGMGRSAVGAATLLQSKGATPFVSDCGDTPDLAEYRQALDALGVGLRSGRTLRGPPSPRRTSWCSAPGSPRTSPPWPGYGNRESRSSPNSSWHGAFCTSTSACRDRHQRQDDHDGTPACDDCSVRALGGTSRQQRYALFGGAPHRTAPRLHRTRGEQLPTRNRFAVSPLDCRGPQI